MDLIGKQFNNWTILECLKGNKGFSPKVKCKCICGSVFIRDKKSIVRGESKGCRQCRVYSYKLPKREGVLNTLFREYKRCAKKNNREVLLTKDEFRKLTKSKCFYCGNFPKTIRTNSNGNSGYTFNGIDRRDNSLGYTIENSVPCCKNCNYMKRKVSEDSFIKHIGMIYKNYRKI